MIRALLKHRLFQPNRHWPGSKAHVPVDICYAVLDVFAWTVFLGSATSVVLLYLEHAPAILARPSFWVVCALPLVAACAAVGRGFPFTLRFALVALVLLAFLVVSTLEAGVMPNTSLYAIVLLAALSLFFGYPAAMAGLGLITALLLVSAWGWILGYLPLTSSPAQSSGMLLDFRSPFVWARVLPIMVLFMAALLTVLHFVLQRLQDTLSESRTSLRLLAVEQEQRARAEVERSRQAELLRSSERKFRTLFETANDAIFLMDEQVFLSCNQKTEAMFGGKRDRIIGQSPIGFSPPQQPDGRDSAGSAREKIAAAFAGTPQNFEWQHLRLDGTPFDAEVSLNRVEVDGAVFLQAIVRDVTERRRTETALHESAVFRKRIFDSSRIPIVVMDAETLQYVDCNEAAVEIYRFPAREAILGKVPADVSAPVQYDGTPSLEKARLYIERALAEGSIAFEWRHQRPDGEIWDAEVHLMSFQSGPRRLLQFTLQDITERKRTAAALDRERRFFEALFEAMPGNAFVIDENGRYLRWNRSFEQNYGVTSEKVEKGAFAMSDTIHPKDREKVAQALRRGLMAGQGSVEYLSIRADGVEVPRLASGKAFGWDGKRYGIGVSLDISERVKAERALRESEERYQQIAKCVPDLIWTTDFSGRYTYANSAVERTHGWKVEEFLKLTFRDVVTPRQAAKDAAMIEDGLKQAGTGHYDRNAIRTYESEEMRKDGSVFLAEVSATFLWSEEGKPVGIIGITRDITDRKREEEKRQALQAQLIQAQKMEAVGQLAGGVAHDFNNILTAILLQLNMLQDDPKLSPEVHSGLKDLEGEAKRAANLTRQLLMFSRRQVLHPQVLDLNSLLGNLLKMLRRLIGENIHLEFNGALGDLWLEADPGMLEQVVMNLVVNARDAMPGGGRITLTTRSVNLVASASQRNPEAYSGQFVCLAVSDNGCGMDEATLERIFEPFFTTKEAGKGTGLGLATVYGIAKQHRGWIEVDSAVGRGSTFSIYLPAREQVAAIVDPILEVGSVPGGNENLLVVEDEDSVRRGLLEILGKLGYRVWAAGNGPDALRQWAQRDGQIDLVITDVVMPGGISGVELADRLLQQKQALKVILMSGYSPEKMVRGLQQTRGVSFLQKPFEAARLARMVRTCLDA